MEKCESVYNAIKVQPVESGQFVSNVGLPTPLIQTQGLYDTIRSLNVTNSIKQLPQTPTTIFHDIWNEPSTPNTMNKVLPSPLKITSGLFDDFPKPLSPIPSESDYELDPTILHDKIKID